jgi:hypothetical protein
MFEILIKPKKFESYSSWSSKVEGVVLVEKEEDIEPMWELLCEQDEYWENYKELVKVAPKEIEDKKDLERLCRYCGKTDIYDVDELRKKAKEKGFDFKLFQYSECNDY